MGAKFHQLRNYLESKKQESEPKLCLHNFYFHFIYQVCLILTYFDAVFSHLNVIFYFRFYFSPFN